MRAASFHERRAARYRLRFGYSGRLARKLCR